MAFRRRPPKATLALALAVPLALAGSLLAPANTAGAGPETLGLESLEASLGEIRTLLLDANFRTALGVAESTRLWADELPSSPEVREARSRLQVLMATAHVALGEDDAARECMRKAVAVWPLLRLTPRDTSPRVVAVYRAVRGSRGAKP